MQARVDRLTINSDGELSNAKPATFLEIWNTVFAAAGLLWILLVAAGLVIFYLTHLPAQPSLSGLTPAQAKDALDLYKQVYDQYRQTLTDVFDLLVTRTVLPIVTLLLGYLFGRTQSAANQ